MQFKKLIVSHNDHDVPIGLICKAMHLIESENKSGSDVVEFNNIIGFNELVEVTDEDEFYYKQRGDRPYESRFVKNKLPVPCSRLVVVWKRINEQVIRVITAYYTDRLIASCPDEPANIFRKHKRGVPYSAEQIQEAFDFWSTHAFVETLPRELL